MSVASRGSAIFPYSAVVKVHVWLYTWFLGTLRMHRRFFLRSTDFCCLILSAVSPVCVCVCVCVGKALSSRCNYLFSLAIRRLSVQKDKRWKRAGLEKTRCTVSTLPADEALYCSTKRLENQTRPQPPNANAGTQERQTQPDDCAQGVLARQLQPLQKPSTQYEPQLVQRKRRSRTRPAYAPTRA